MDQTQNVPAPCLSCGETIAGRYCGSCGEKVLKDHEKSVAHFIGEAVHAITHADGKFLKSLKYLIIKPGTLTVNYLEGRRKQFMSPLSLFVFANLLYLLFAPVDALNSYYVSQKGQPYKAIAQRKFEEKMKVTGWTEMQLREKYNAKSGKLAKLLLILLVLYFSIPLAIVHLSEKRYYVDHLVFSTEVINFLILIVFFIIPWLQKLILAASNHWFGFDFQLDWNGLASRVIIILGLSLYLVIATRRVYGSSWWFSSVKSLILFLGLFVCIVLYRFTLFHTTMAML